MKIQFESSTQCNARCTFCPRYDMTRPGGEMSDELFRKIIKDGKEMRRSFFVPFLNGEPFMFPRIWEWLDYMKAEGVRVHIYTNAERMDVDRLVGYRNISCICCGINAATEETYDKVVRGPEYEVVKANMEELIRKARCKIYASMVVVDENQHEVELFEKTWGKYAIFGEFKNWGGARHCAIEKKGERYPCWALLNTMSVLWDGRVVPCCFPAGSQVKTISGIDRNIEDLVVGDIVLTHTMREGRVLNTFKRITDELVSFTISGLPSRAITLTGDHPVLGFRKRKWTSMDAHVPSWFPIVDLSVGDYVAIPTMNIIPTGEVDDQYYLYGLFLAEGYYQKDKREPRKGRLTGLHWCFGSHEDILVGKAAELIRRIYGIEPSIYENKKRHNLVVTVNSPNLAEDYRRMFGEYCYGKRINYDLIPYDPERLYSLYLGFLDGDGHIDKLQRQTVASTSQTLIMQLRDILIQNGKYPTLSESSRQGRRTAYFLYVAARLRRPWWGKGGIQTDKFFFERITTKTVQKVDATFVYNIEVEGDNSYIVNQIAFHNCLDYDGKLILGDANKQTLTEIWHQSHWMRRRHRRLDFDMVPCQECNHNI